MSCSYIDIYTAKKKMVLKNNNLCLSFITTLWKGEVIMCCYNNLAKKTVTIFAAQVINSDDANELEKLITEFISGKLDKI